MAKRNPRAPGPNDVPLPGMPEPKRVAPKARVSRAVQNRTAFDLEQAVELAENGDDSMLLPYQPTPSINPPRPRTLAAGYDKSTETLRVRFRDGAIYEYYDVPERVWRNFKRVKSPGRAINRTLNQYEYAPMDI